MEKVIMGGAGLIRRLICILALGVSGCATPIATSTTTAINPRADLNRYRRIAIMPFESKSGDGTAMADAFVTQLMAAGFSIVERHQTEAILRELKLNYSGALSQKEIKEVGKLANVDALVFGSMDESNFTGYSASQIGNLGGASGNSGMMKHLVSLRIVDVETGEVILSSTFEKEKIPTLMRADIQAKWECHKTKKRCQSRSAYPGGPPAEPMFKIPGVSK